MSTLAPPKERLDRGDRSGLGRAWRVIVLNDNHNTFDGVAFALSSVLPGVDFDAGMRLATRIDRAPGRREGREHGEERRSKDVSVFPAEHVEPRLDVWSARSPPAR